MEITELPSQIVYMGGLSLDTWETNDLSHVLETNIGLGLYTILCFKSEVVLWYALARSKLVDFFETHARKQKKKGQKKKILLVTDRAVP